MKRLLICLLLVSVVGCGGGEQAQKTPSNEPSRQAEQVDPNKEANGLFVEAVQLIESAKSKSNQGLDDEAIKDYEKALSNVQKIIDDHSKSDLAVKLITGETFFPRSTITSRVAYLKEQLKINEDQPQFGRRDRYKTFTHDKSDFPVTIQFKLSDRPGIASYEIVKHTLPKDEATIKWDPAGNVTIVAKNTGEFTLEVRTTDKGVPPKVSDVVVFTVRIRERGSPRTPAPEPPKFDFANTAFFVASVELGGQREAWVKRRESGKTIKFHVGDIVNIGSIKGKVVRISLKELELADGKKRLIIHTGKALSSAKVID